MIIFDYSKHPQYIREHYPFVPESERIARFSQSIRDALRKEFIRAANYRCALCDHFFEATELELDHIIPLIRGGTNDRHNLQIICLDCHASKTIYDMGRAERPYTGADGFPIEHPGS